MSRPSARDVEGFAAWLPWLLGFLFLLWQVCFQFVYAFLADPIQAHFKLTSFEAASLVSVYLLAYGLMQIPAGIAVDRFGVRWLLPAVGLGGAVFVALFGIATDYTQLVASRLLAGVFMAFVFPAMGKIARRRLPPRRFALAMALADMCFGAGAVIASGLVAWVAPEAWRSLVLGQAAVGAALALVLLVGLAPLREGSASDWETASAWKSIRTALGQRQLLLGLCIYVWGAGLTFGFGGYWNVKLQESCGCTAPQVSELSTALFGGLAVGMLAAGLAGGQSSRLRPILITGSISSLVGVAALLAFSSMVSLVVMSALNFFVGVALGTCSLAFAVAAQGVPARQAATVVAIVNAGGCLAGALFQELPVWLGGGTATLTSVAVVYVSVALFGVVATFFLPRKPSPD